jgi:biotin carboxyl carrier protein
MTRERSPVPAASQRAVRVSLDRATHAIGEPIVLAPSGDSLAAMLLGGEPGELRLERFDAIHAVVVEGHGDGTTRRPVIMLPLERAAGAVAGPARREVLVDGWRIQVEIEPERLARLRERAVRGRPTTVGGGPTEVRATIPGRVVGVSVVPGDPVVVGQPLLLVEAMKMQNEVRAPRDGVIASVAAGVGGTVEVGDLLVELE